MDILSSTAKKRILSEAKILTSEELEWVIVEPDSSDLSLWNVMLLGPENTPYSDGIFNIELHFPGCYPIKPPHVRFITKTYHPSIETATGEICQDIVAQGWNEQSSVKAILFTLRQLLGDVEEAAKESPLQMEIAALVRDNREKFNTIAREHTDKYAH